MKIRFQKYQATGNDFIVLDNRTSEYSKLDKTQIVQLCHRKFGIGADGLVLISESESVNFMMTYYNADGGIGSFCGNGSRAAVRFASTLGLISKSGGFEAYDGIHDTEIANDRIKIKMADVQNGSNVLDGTFIDTGSPHYVEICNNLDQFDVVTKGRSVRHNKVFAPYGTNVNFVERLGEDNIHVRTFERGVEDETLSCGTGVTASALVTAQNDGMHTVQVMTPGGNLLVSFERKNGRNQNIWLEGPAQMTFEGEISL